MPDVELDGVLRGRGEPEGDDLALGDGRGPLHLLQQPPPRAPASVGGGCGDTEYLKNFILGKDSTDSKKQMIMYNLDAVAHHPHHLVIDGGKEQPGLGEPPAGPLGDLLVPEVRAEALPGQRPEPVEADKHDQGLEEELGQEEQEEGLEILEHSVELNKLSEGADRGPEVDRPLVTLKPVLHDAIVKYTANNVIVRLVIFPDFDNILVFGHYVDLMSVRVIVYGF